MRNIIAISKMLENWKKKNENSNKRFIFNFGNVYVIQFCSQTKHYFWVHGENAFCMYILFIYNVYFS